LFFVSVFVLALTGSIRRLPLGKCHASCRRTAVLDPI
jgi:hypothetical protein